MSKEIQDVIEQVMADARAVAHLYQETSLFSWEPAQPAPPEPVDKKPEPEDQPFEQPALETPEPSAVPDQPSDVAPASGAEIPEASSDVDSPNVVESPNADYAPGHKFEQQQEEFPVQPFPQLQSLEAFPEAPTPTPADEAAPEASVPVREESEAPQAQEMPRGGVDTPRIDAEVVEPPMGVAPTGEVFRQDTVDAPASESISRPETDAPTATTVQPETSEAPQSGVVDQREVPAPESFAFSWDTSAEPQIEPLPIPERSQEPEPEFSALISDQADIIARRLEEHLQDGFAKMYGQVALTIDQRMDQLALSMDRRHAR